MLDPTVLIVGAGPAGLAAAYELARQGIRDILVIDRDDGPGGLPRYCMHPGFGLGYLAIPRSGPGFVKRLLQALSTSSVRFACRTTMIALSEGPMVTVTGPETGYRTLRPRAVVLATGVRESHRGNRLIPGERPAAGIFTTGLLQQMVSRGVPFPAGLRSLVVVGTDHVSFSAIWTARHAGLKVCAMVDERASVGSFALVGWLARAAGVDLRLGWRITAIRARNDLVASVVLERGGECEEIDCDGVIFTGGWIPEVAAIATSPVDIDFASGGIRTDADGRTNVAGVFAAGNMRHPLKASGSCARQGRSVAAAVSEHLRLDPSGTPPTMSVRVSL
jgi:NADPH-dependent 2,4-dienoyl-CoA reductase/sulfur reductase-like enzyme